MHCAVQGVIVFDVGGLKWSLDLRSGTGTLTEGDAEDDPDLTLTTSHENFAKLVSGQLNPQQVRYSAL
jgi:putative sterol carrier protein